MKRIRVPIRWSCHVGITLLILTALSFVSHDGRAQDKKTNILVIMGDDIGWYNASCCNRWDMGYWTPNIDRIAKEGALFTCWYGQQSWTAGRAAFITGQSPIRTGLTKVGLPGTTVGLQKEDPNVADFPKNLGYATAQFGKNHLGDRNEFLPTVHGWPDGGSTPYRGEKATGWEGGYRVPMCIRWPGVIKPGTVYNDFFCHEDLLPTFAAAAGEPDLVDKVAKGCQCGDQTFKVHLDGHNLMPYFKGETTNSPDKEFLYWSDDGDLFAIRVLNWKIAFVENNSTGLGVWKQTFTRLRVPDIFNLRADPFERGDTSMQYDDWMMHRAFVVVPAQAIVAKWLDSFKEFPMRQKPSSFNLDEVMAKLQEAGKGSN